MDYHRWSWGGLDVTSVSEGHAAVREAEVISNKNDVAKLTFGEILHSGVSKMLDNLGASKKKSLQDLGCGPAKVMLQAFLMYPNLTDVTGVELAKGRYLLAEKNFRELVLHGYQGREFFISEYIELKTMRVTELTPDRNPGMTAKDGFKVGDRVDFFDENIPEKIKQNGCHRAIITRVLHNNGVPTYNVKLEMGGKLASIKSMLLSTRLRFYNVSRDRLFLPGTARSISIWFGNLFDMPGAFNADICILETDFPLEMRISLIDGLKNSPIGTKFLTYHDLKMWHGIYDHNLIKQIDLSIYDNSRYLTSWSQGWRFYIWERVDIYTRVYTWPSDSASFVTGKKVGVHRSELPCKTKFKMWEEASIVHVTKRTGMLTVQLKRCSIRISLPATCGRIRLYDHEHAIGDQVTCYWPQFIHNRSASAYDLYRARVKSQNPDGTYEVSYEDGDLHKAVSPNWIFKLPVLRYKKGQKVYSCWPQYAQNKNSKYRYRMYPGTIEKVNPDATYDVEYSHGDSATRVREMWIDFSTEERRGSTKFGCHTSIELRVIDDWSPLTVALWMIELGMPEYARRILRAKMGGDILRSNDNLEILLEDKLKMNREDATIVQKALKNIAEFCNFIKDSTVKKKLSIPSTSSNVSKRYDVSSCDEISSCNDSLDGFSSPRKRPRRYRTPNLEATSPSPNRRIFEGRRSGSTSYIRCSSWSSYVEPIKEPAKKPSSPGGGSYREENRRKGR